MSWGTNRRNTIVFVVILLLIIPVALTTFFVFYNPPNCFDGKQNGNETGVDCGGSCELICTKEALPPTVIWERYFMVDSGNYNVMAYIENQNPNAGILNAHYIFKLYNSDGVNIATREGSTHIYPKSVLPIIENGLFTDKQIPARISFDFVGDMVFEKEQPKLQNLIVEDEKYFEDNLSSGLPKVTAKITNITLDPIYKIKVIALLYDTFDNVVGSSSTFVEKIDGEQSKNVVFTWPKKFKEEISRIEVVPIYE